MGLDGVFFRELYLRSKKRNLKLQRFRKKEKKKMEEEAVKTEEANIIRSRELDRCKTEGQLLKPRIKKRKNGDVTKLEKEDSETDPEKIRCKMKKKEEEVKTEEAKIIRGRELDRSKMEGRLIKTESENWKIRDVTKLEEEDSGSYPEKSQRKKEKKKKAEGAIKLEGEESVSEEDNKTNEESKEKAESGSEMKETISDYEKLRLKTIKENRERMEKLGMFVLSNKLKEATTAKKTRPLRPERKIEKEAPVRHSTRLQNKDIKKDDIANAVAKVVKLTNDSIKKSVTKVVEAKESQNDGIYIEEHGKLSDETSRKHINDGVNGRTVHRCCLKEGDTKNKSIKKSTEKGLMAKDLRNEEVYTHEHEKLLSTCEQPWTLFVDGYKDGKRFHDPSGKTCHQCRQKTVGHRTSCSKCNSGRGQLCGDCLYTRYGENVLEAKKNLNWICPVCRGICNCSHCRKQKGWPPTGPIFSQVHRRGYKSVAHYLIQTRQSEEPDE